MCIKIRNFQVTLNCLLSHIQFSFMYMYLMCCSIPLIFIIIIIHWDPFLFCDPKQMKMQFSIYGIFCCCCCCLRSVPESLSATKKELEFSEESENVKIV
jgi:hypothetical protein